uniref:Phospholipase/carboxylesterase/thioesterase domain-containing protein n=1 Tax=Zooxanthella nutricula TaxID=1333877 RepID=A0A6U9FYI6_9DINO|mmetsp:Transcript_46321/g.140497  ORF Transcript_46321/g.140497 Transcript_46321/m.140497 type:complete len:509 (+) Transcript_46321:6-1532(+)
MHVLGERVLDYAPSKALTADLPLSTNSTPRGRLCGYGAVHALDGMPPRPQEESPGSQPARPSRRNKTEPSGSAGFMKCMTENVETAWGPHALVHDISQMRVDRSLRVALLASPPRPRNSEAAPAEHLPPSISRSWSLEVHVGSSSLASPRGGRRPSRTPIEDDDRLSVAGATDRANSSARNREGSAKKQEASRPAPAGAGDPPGGKPGDAAADETTDASGEFRRCASRKGSITGSENERSPSSLWSLSTAASSSHEIVANQVPDGGGAGDGHVACYPFPQCWRIYAPQTDTRQFIEVVAHRPPRRDRRHLHAHGAVLFLPGVHGGVGPCRAANATYDADALFPTLATRLSQIAGLHCYRLSWNRQSPDIPATLHGIVTLMRRVLRRGRREVFIVGHSLGGSLAYVLADLLGKHFAEQPRTWPRGARVAGICSLAAPCGRAQSYMSSLGGIPKLIYHGKDDQVIPCQAALEIFKEATEPISLRVLDGGGHDLRSHKAMLVREIEEWVTG